MLNITILILIYLILKTTNLVFKNNFYFSRHDLNDINFSFKNRLND